MYICYCIIAGLCEGGSLCCGLPTSSASAKMDSATKYGRVVRRMDRKIIARSYGLDGVQRSGQRAIARGLGITRGRVAEALAKADALVAVRA